MSGKPISELNTLSTLSSTDRLIINDNNVETKTITYSNVIKELKSDLPLVTTSAKGLMSAADKQKLDSLETDGGGGGDPVVMSGNKYDITSYYPEGVSSTNATSTQNLNAFTAALTATGGVVYFPPGTYNFSGKQILLNNAASIYGDGPKLCRLNFGSVGTAIKVDHGSSDLGEFRLRGLSINKTSSSGYHIHYISRGDVNTHQALIEDLFIVGSADDAIRCENGTFVTCRDVHIVPVNDTITGGIHFKNGPGPGDTTSTNCLIDNCVFRNFDTGVKVTGNSEGITITDSQMINMGTGINISPSNGSGEPFFMIHGCHMDTKQYGVIIKNVIQSKIVNNDIRQHGNSSPWVGIKVDAGSGTSASFLNMITNNSLLAGNSGTRTGVFIDDAVYTVVSNNMFHNLTRGVNCDYSYEPSTAPTNINIWLLDNMFFNVSTPYTGSMFTSQPFDPASPAGTRNYYIMRNPKAYSGSYYQNYPTYDSLRDSNIGLIKGDNPSDTGAILSVDDYDLNT